MVRGKTERSRDMSLEMLERVSEIAEVKASGNETVERKNNDFWVETVTTASPSILLITSGTGDNNDNAFQLAKRTGFRLVIALYPEGKELVSGATMITQLPVLSSTVMAEELTQAAHAEGIESVVTYRQDCWVEDEFDDLIKLENSQYTIVAF